MQRQTTKGINYFLLALCAFAGLGVEVLYGYIIEPAIYGVQIQEWTTAQIILHWAITCITWGVITLLLVKTANKKYGFQVNNDSVKMQNWQWIVIGLFIILMAVSSYIDWNGFKPAIEYKRLGLLKFIFQYIYYFFEAGMITLIIVFGQMACEKWFKKANFPYGGLLAAITWGVVHFFTKADFATGMISMIGGFTFGVVYLLTNRNLLKTYLILFIMFIV